MKKEAEKQEPKQQMATLPVEVLNQVLDYLGSQPYTRVFKLIPLIQENVKVN